MISRKHHQIVLAFFMSFVIRVFNVGLVTSIITIWVKAWAFIVAFSTIVVVSLLVRRLVDFVLHDEHSHTQ
ncbi:DUF2798 domain-containing protein [uncultured Paraglaciecola sp.]|uniref:DUF2798 domain-containing protein n=2 Tax=Paraglaciecola TaxID=1621534 RepID=UPI002596A5CB|nr:DUF2798 domain-containing protein [uncultured Paraglaciecola sp.]